MITNTDCTILRKTPQGYKAIYYPAVFWEDTEAVRIQSDGAAGISKARIFIPMSCTAPKKRDYILRGKILTEIKESDLSGIEKLTVLAADWRDFGSEELKHYEVTAG